MNERERAAGLAKTPGYSYAESVGDHLFVAGQVPVNAAGNLVGRGDVRIQAQRCLENLQLVIGSHGFDMADVRRITVHVVGPQSNLSGAWDAVRTWFDGRVPPATLLGASLLGHLDQLVEIDATVVRDSAQVPNTRPGLDAD